MDDAHLDDKVSLSFLGVNVLVEVGLAGLDGCLDVLEAVAALLHVTLDLPCELHLGGDVEVDLVVAQLCHTVIVEGVEALNDEHLHHETVGVQCCEVCVFCVF